MGKTRNSNSVGKDESRRERIWSGTGVQTVDKWDNCRHVLIGPPIAIILFFI